MNVSWNHQATEGHLNPQVHDGTPAFEDIFGLDREAALRGDNMLGWLELIVVDDRDIAAENLRRVRNGERVTSDYRVKRPKDGNIRWIRNTDFPINDSNGKIVHIGGIAQDITAIKSAEEALASVQLRQRAFLEGIPQLVWRATEGGYVSWSGPQWVNYTGQTEVESHEMGWLEVVHPDDRNAAQTAWANANQTSGFEVEYRIRESRTDAYRWFHTRATPVRDDNGVILEWLGTSTDIEDLKGLQTRQAMLVEELQLRSGNLILEVQNITDVIIKESGSLEEFRNRFSERLKMWENQ